MAILSKGTTYADGDQITSTNLNALVDSATFAAGAVESGGGLQLNGSGQLKVAGNVDIGTSNLTATGSISLGATTFNDNNITNVGSIAVDTIIADNTDVTIDAAGDIILDADGAQVRIKDDGTERFVFNTDATPELDVTGGDFTIHANTSDADIIFTGNDGGASITALTLDMSAAGAATFNDKITAVGTSVFTNLDISGDIDVDGNVGIGTTSPAKKLHIASNANSQTADYIPGIRIENTDTHAADTDVVGEIEFFSQDLDDPNDISGFIKNVAEDAGTKFALTFGSKTTGANATEAMRIDADGNVGIGTTTPDEELHISASVPKIQIQDSDGTDQYGQFYHSAGVTAIQARNNTSDGTIVFQKYDGTTTDETMRISSAGHVGINNVSPGTILDINDDASIGTGLRVTGGGGGGAMATFTRDVSGGTSGTVMINAAGNDPQIRFTSAGDNWSIGLDSTVFNICDGNAVGSDQRLVIDTSGNVGIATTSPDEKLDVVGAGRFSTGVTFGTDTAAANKLDDYEEGSWTPTISFGGASVDVEYDLQVGTYTKIGDLVTASCYMDLADSGTSTGDAVLAGLPFTSRSLTGNLAPATLRLSNISFADIPMGYNSSNTSTITLQESTNAGTTTSLTEANFSDTSIVMMSVAYRV